MDTIRPPLGEANIWCKEFFDGIRDATDIAGQSLARELRGNVKKVVENAGGSWPQDPSAQNVFIMMVLQKTSEGSEARASGIENSASAIATAIRNGIFPKRYDELIVPEDLQNKRS